jgi:predicted nuclease with RNAse H fold
MRTLGIDLAAQAKDTAACVVRGRDGAAELELIDVGLTNDDLLPLMRKADVVGLDAPFGWPADFAEAVRHWNDKGEWPPVWDDKNGCPTLRLRETDTCRTLDHQ